MKKTFDYRELQRRHLKQGVFCRICRKPFNSKAVKIPGGLVKESFLKFSGSSITGQCGLCTAKRGNKGLEDLNRKRRTAKK